MKKYISYFQSVTTIGIISEADTIEDAELKSLDKFNSQDLSCGILSQTPFEISDTESFDTSDKMYNYINSNSLIKEEIKEHIIKSYHMEEKVFDNMWGDIEKKIIEKIG